MNFLSFFYWTTEFLLFLSRKRKKKGTHRKSFIYLKDFSFVVNFFFFIFTFICFFLCVSFRYLVLQKIAHPCYAVTRSMPTSRVY